MTTIRTRNDQGNIQTITTSVRMGYRPGDVVRVHGLLAGPGNAGKMVDVVVYAADDAPWWMNAYGWARFKFWASPDVRRKTLLTAMVVFTAVLPYILR